MFTFALGVAAGAAFAPFWMMLFGMVKDKIAALKPPAK